MVRREVVVEESSMLVGSFLFDLFVEKVILVGSATASWEEKLQLAAEEPMGFGTSLTPDNNHL